MGTRVPFFDYLGIARRPVIVASEPDEIRERIEKQLAQISESYEQAAAAGRSRSGTSPKPVDGRPTAKAGAGTETWAPEPSAILISWPDIDRQLASASVLEELGLDDGGDRRPTPWRLAPSP